MIFVQILDFLRGVIKVGLCFHAVHENAHFVAKYGGQFLLWNGSDVHPLPCGIGDHLHLELGLIFGNSSVDRPFELFGLTCRLWLLALMLAKDHDLIRVVDLGQLLHDGSLPLLESKVSLLSLNRLRDDFAHVVLLFRLPLLSAQIVRKSIGSRARLLVTLTRLTLENLLIAGACKLVLNQLLLFLLVARAAISRGQKW